MQHLGYSPHPGRTFASVGLLGAIGGLKAKKCCLYLLAWIVPSPLEAFTYRRLRCGSLAAATCRSVAEEACACHKK